MRIKDSFRSKNLESNRNWTANKESLITNQKAILQKYPTNVTSINEILRDPKWRPLTDQEIEVFTKESHNKHWSNKAIIEYDDVYWA